MALVTKEKKKSKKGPKGEIVDTYIVAGLPLFLSSPEHIFEPVLYFQISI